MEAFEPLIEHLQVHRNGYIGGGIVALIVIAVLHRYALPIIFKILELAAYYAIMHVVVGGFVRMVNWFKGATAMKAVSETDMGASPGWKTPWIEFWTKELYTPEWLIYMELGAIIAITGLIWYFRPIYFKVKVDKKPEPKKTPMGKDVKSHMAGSYLAPLEEEDQGNKRARKGKGKR